MKHFKRFILPILLLLLSVFLKYFLVKYALVSEESYPIFDILGSILMISGVAWVLISSLRTLKRILLDNFDTSAEDNLRSRKYQTQFNILESVFIVVIIVIAVGAVLMLFDDVRKLGISLFASAGVAGLIVGLAAQKFIGAVIAGLQIAITQPIRLDDVVIIEGEWGRIEEITLTYVVVKIWDLRRLIVPTSYFFEKPFQNWTRTSADILGTVFIYTDYQISFDALRIELTRVLEATPLWDKKVNVLQVTEARQNGVEVRALMSAKDASIAWDLRVHVREKLIEFIQKNYPESLPKTRILVEGGGEPAVAGGGFGKLHSGSNEI